MCSSFLDHCLMNGAYEERFKKLVRMILEDLKKDLISGVWSVLPLYERFGQSKNVIELLNEEISVLYLKEL